MHIYISSQRVLPWLIRSLLIVSIRKIWIEGLKSQTHCLSSLQGALWKFKHPRGWAHFSRLNSRKLAVEADRVSEPARRRESERRKEREGESGKTCLALTMPQISNGHRDVYRPHVGPPLIISLYIYICMYVCMYIYIYIYIYVCISLVSLMHINILLNNEK